MPEAARRGKTAVARAPSWYNGKALRITNRRTLVQQLLRLLADKLIFFFAENRYRLADSSVGKSYEDSVVEWRGKKLSWRLVSDRSQIFLDCAPPSSNAKQWFSIDLLIRLIEGRVVDTAELSDEYVEWLREHLDEVEARFEKGRLDETLGELKRLKKMRSREMFG